jgi:hypothetical protein
VVDVKQATSAEFVACPDGGRRVTRSRRVRLGDAAPGGRLRLDALARYLQDIAGDDVDEAGITGAWVLRRVTLSVGRLPSFRDDVELVTFCSGTGGRWAERRTTMTVGGEPSVESVALWVYVDEAGCCRPWRRARWPSRSRRPPRLAAWRSPWKPFTAGSSSATWTRPWRSSCGCRTTSSASTW